MQESPTTDPATPRWHFCQKGSRVAALKDIQGPGLYAKLPSYGQAYMDLLIGEFNSLRDIYADDKAFAQTSGFSSVAFLYFAREFLEFGAHLRHRLETRISIFLQRPINDPRQLRRYFGS